MRRIFSRLPATAMSEHFTRVFSPTQIRHYSSTVSPHPQTQTVELNRAATPIDGCDYNHWLVIMDPPIDYPLRHQIVQRYIQTLASALGSEEEAKRSIYSVSTKYYYAFGCKIDENVIRRVRSMPNVRWVLPDSHLSPGSNNYGGEPFTDGCVVPYDDVFHEDWLQDQSDSGFKRRARRKRSTKKQHKADHCVSELNKPGES